MCLYALQVHVKHIGRWLLTSCMYTTSGKRPSLPKARPPPSHHHRHLPMTPLSDVVGHTLNNRYKNDMNRPMTNDIPDYSGAEVLDPPMRPISPMGLDYTYSVGGGGQSYDYPSSFRPTTGYSNYDDGYTSNPMRGRPALPPTYDTYDDYDSFGFGGMGASSGDNGGFQPYEDGSVRTGKRRFPLAMGSVGTTTTTTAATPFGAGTPTLTPPSSADKTATYFDPMLSVQGFKNDASDKGFFTLPTTTASTPSTVDKDTNKKYALNNNIRVRRRKKPTQMKRKPMSSSQERVGGFARLFSRNGSFCHMMTIVKSPYFSKKEPIDITVDPIGALERIKEESKRKRFGISSERKMMDDDSSNEEADPFSGFGSSR